jgi:hypothetical protein
MSLRVLLLGFPSVYSKEPVKFHTHDTHERDSNYPDG